MSTNSYKWQLYIISALLLMSNNIALQLDGKIKYVHLIFTIIIYYILFDWATMKAEQKGDLEKELESLKKVKKVE